MRKKSDTAKSLHSRNRIHASFQDVIAETYFKASPKKSKNAFAAANSIPWFIAGAALCAAFALFISKSNIDIKIRMSDNSPFVNKESVGPMAEGSKTNGVFIVSGGESNGRIVEKNFFVGDAKSLSKTDAAEVVLYNSKALGWASYRLEFKKPLDLTGAEMMYTARGDSGGENLVMMVIDSDNKAYKVEGEVSRLTKDWQTYTVNFRPLKDTVDLANVAMVRFEFGSLTAGNKANAIIYLKDIYASKSRKIKWL